MCMAQAQKCLLLRGPNGHWVTHGKQSNISIKSHTSRICRNTGGQCNTNFIIGKLPWGSLKRNWYNLNRCSPYTEIFSKRRKIYSECVESMRMPGRSLLSEQTPPHLLMFLKRIKCLFQGWDLFRAGRCGRIISSTWLHPDLFSFFFQDRCPAAIAPVFELSDLYFCMNLLQTDAGQTLFAVAAGNG